MWAYDSVFYQIYPIGFCGAPWENDGEEIPRIRKVIDWIPQIKRTGANAVYFNPVFESDTHGYDTRDYRKIDCRLGNNADFADVCGALRERGVRVVLDAVFNHVGRGFWAFQDVLRNREASAYRDWFFIEFGGDNGYHDGLRYEGWEGHFELVRLNLSKEAVAAYLLDSVRGWVESFGIDGLRLDVAYCLDRDFLRRLRAFCDSIKPDFFLVGEMIGGDYRQLLDCGLTSVTNYECYKGLYSGFNSGNLFEIGHSLLRQFGPEPWTLYRGEHLLCFADNHDVSRVASILDEPRHLPLLYALLFGMPGIPCIYYGSEWGARGEKRQGSDAGLRPAFAEPEENELTRWIARCAKAHRESRALCFGDYRSLVLASRQIILERACDGERVLVAVNADSAPYTAHFDARAGGAIDLLTGLAHDFGGGSVLAPFSAAYWRIDS